MFTFNANAVAILVLCETVFAAAEPLQDKGGLTADQKEVLAAAVEGWTEIEDSEPCLNCGDVVFFSDETAVSVGTREDFVGYLCACCASNQEQELTEAFESKYEW